jgi:UDP-N-acetylglucosamine acyltransferase
MPIRPSARFHATAVISPEADIADGVEVGPFVVVEGPVRVGPGCVIRPHAHLIGPLTMGRGNTVYGGAVLGERPQHLKYNNEPTGVEIGDDNVFREHVTVHRGTTHSWNTIIGSRNFFMAGAHVAHDCRVGNGCILANGALLGGHCVVGDGAYLSGNSAVHQFVRVGRLAMLGGASGSSKDMPPFVTQQYINTICGVNVVGMRRAGLTAAQIDAVRRAYHIIFRSGQTIPSALAWAERELGSVDVVRELIDFIRHSARGVSSWRDRRHDGSQSSLAA